MAVPGIIRCDTFGPLEVKVYLFSIENIEDELSSRVHEMLVDVVHIVIDDDVSHTLLLVVLEFLLLLQ